MCPMLMLTETVRRRPFIGQTQSANAITTDGEQCAG